MNRLSPRKGSWNIDAHAVQAAGGRQAGLMNPIALIGSAAASTRWCDNGAGLPDWRGMGRGVPVAFELHCPQSGAGVAPPTEGAVAPVMFHAPEVRPLVAMRGTPAGGARLSSG